jgi:hypothetical protein
VQVAGPTSYSHQNTTARDMAHDTRDRMRRHPSTRPDSRPDAVEELPGTHARDRIKKRDPQHRSGPDVKPLPGHAAFGGPKPLRPPGFRIVPN